MWLLRIATNLHRDLCRGNRPTEPILAEPIDGAPPIAARIEHRECVAQALAALDDLPPLSGDAAQLSALTAVSQPAGDGADLADGE